MDERFDLIIDRRKTDSVKWAKIDGYKKDILPLWVADMDFKSPEIIKKSIKNRLDEGVFGYFNIDDGIYQSIIDWNYKRNSYKIDKSWLVLSPSVLTSLNLILFSLFKRGDGVIIQPPVYPPFYEAVKNHGLEVVENPLIKTKDGYKINYIELEEQMKKAKAMILCNPQNPTGRVWNLEELEKIVNLAIKYNIFIISDDIHSDLIIDDNTYIPIGSISKDAREISISLISPSKTFNLAGINTSCAIIPNRDIKRKFIKSLNKFRISPTNVFSKEAMRAAYDHGEDWLEDLLNYISGNMEYVISYIEENIDSIKVYKPEATYLMWLDFSNINKSSDEIYKALIEEGNILLNNGKDYGCGGDKYFRLNVATSRKNLMIALDGISKAVKNLKG